MESLTNTLNTVSTWVDNNWLYILAAYPLFMGLLRLLVLIIRKYYPYDDGSRIDGFCDFVEGIMLRSDAILAGLDKMRKGHVIEGVTEIVTGKTDDDDTPTLKP